MRKRLLTLLAMALAMRAAPLFQSVAAPVPQVAEKGSFLRSAAMTFHWFWYLVRILVQPEMTVASGQLLLYQRPSEAYESAWSGEQRLVRRNRRTR
jgi:hypothetical protein